MDLSALFAQGGPYAVVAVLLGVVAKLWADGQSKDAKIYELQDARLEDTKTAMASVTSAIDTVKATISALQALSARK